MTKGLALVAVPRHAAGAPRASQLRNRAKSLGHAAAATFTAAHCVITKAATEGGAGRAVMGAWATWEDVRIRDNYSLRLPDAVRKHMGVIHATAAPLIH
ncbi:hypothetical protein J6590_025674 [Homalodisca vitripennis]|nr:hypothetical protein J6590_025674 [Homalodisca vitripennis]